VGGEEPTKWQHNMQKIRHKSGKTPQTEKQHTGAGVALKFPLQP